MVLDRSAPETDKQWSDSVARRADRQLKHRATGDSRRVPVPPALTALLVDHLKRYGTDNDGRLFRGERGGLLAGVTYTRMWDRAGATTAPPRAMRCSHQGNRPRSSCGPRISPARASSASGKAATCPASAVSEPPE